MMQSCPGRFMLCIQIVTLIVGEIHLWKCFCLFIRPDRRLPEATSKALSLMRDHVRNLQSYINDVTDVKESVKLIFAFLTCAC